MCLSEAESKVIRTLPARISLASRRARLLPRIVPPVPPPTIRICIDLPRAAIGAAESLRFTYHDVPHAIYLSGAHHLVTNFLDPFRNVICRSLVRREHFEFIADPDEFHVGNEFHQRAGAERVARIQYLPLWHKTGSPIREPASKRPRLAAGRVAQKLGEPERLIQIRLELLTRRTEDIHCHRTWIDPGVPQFDGLPKQLLEGRNVHLLHGFAECTLRRGLCAVLREKARECVHR